MGERVPRSEFMQFVLDDDGLRTPDGVIDPRTVRVARIDRTRVREHYRGGDSTSPAAVFGGAVLGGLIAGPVGAVAGAVGGSYVRDRDSDEDIPRTVSAVLRIESDSVSSTVDIPLDRIGAAEKFLIAVRDAAGLE